VAAWCAVTAETGAPPWQDVLASALVRTGIEAACWVPDKRLAPIVAALEEAGVPVRTLTREEECIGYAAGFRAAGGAPAVLVQCSGLGNSFNAIGSLATPFGLGFVLVLSMRGTLGERNPAQVELGRNSKAMLALFGIQSFSISSGAAVDAVVRGAYALADGARQVVAIVLEPELELEAGT
jgi:sulfopyruvate decarboxylase alpha subunit